MQPRPPYRCTTLKNPDSHAAVSQLALGDMEIKGFTDGAAQSRMSVPSTHHGKAENRE